VAVLVTMDAAQRTRTCQRILHTLIKFVKFEVDMVAYSQVDRIVPRADDAALKGHSHEKIHMFFWFDSVENIK